MALGLNYEKGTGGPITPIVKYNAKAGRIIRVDRENDQTVDTDITREFKAVMDLENIETGWIHFDSNSAPDFQVSKLGSGMPAQPSDKHRQGLRIMIKLGTECAGGKEAVREVACTAKAALQGFDELHDLYTQGLAANAGKLPVVVLENTVADVTDTPKGKNTNYKPVWKIVAWVPRPGDLVYSPRTPSSSSGGSSAPSTGSTRVAPPASVEEDFG